MEKNLSVDKLSENYHKTLNEKGQVFDIKKLLFKPQAKQLRETFQIIGLMKGMQVITGKKWYVRLNENDPPDFYAVTEDLNEKGDKTLLEVGVENLMIPRQAKKETDNFSEDGVANFIIQKKPPYVLSDGTVLGVYADFTTKSFQLNKLVNTLHKHYTTQEIWIYSAINKAGSQWIISKLHPDFTKQATYSL